MQALYASAPPGLHATYRQFVHGIMKVMKRDLSFVGKPISASKQKTMAEDVAEMLRSMCFHVRF